MLEFGLADEGGLGDFSDRGLAFGVEGAKGIYVFAEELDADGEVSLPRKEVEDAATFSELTPLGDLACSLEFPPLESFEDLASRGSWLDYQFLVEG